MFGTQLLGAAAMKHTSKKRKDFGGKLDGTLWIQATESSCVTHMTQSWWTCSPAWQANAPCVFPGSFPCIIAPAGWAGSSLTSAVLCGGLVLREHPRDHAGHHLDGLAKLFPTDCLAIEPVCIHGRFTLLSSQQDTCGHLDYKSALLMHLFLS